MNAATSNLLTPTVIFLLTVAAGTVIRGAEAPGQQSAEHAAVSRALEKFQKLDANRDQQLSSQELDSLAESLTPQDREQRLIVFDLDQTRTLSFDEFRQIPGIVGREARGPIKDPLKEYSEGRINELMASLPNPIDANQLEQLWKGLLPPGFPIRPENWDLNGDGTVEEAEARHVLGVAWGLLRFDDLPARHANGYVFNGSYFDHLDRDHDRLISSHEFITQHSSGQTVARTIFAQADSNEDGQLDLQEIDHAGLFWVDVVAEFLKWDRNFDGQLSQEELLKGGRWQSRLAPCMIPAFDADRSGTLSLPEYLFSPLGNPILNWTSARYDRNGDGVLQPDEFFEGEAMLCRGLAADYFQRLDLNSDGTLSLLEFRFSTDPHKLTPLQRLQRHDRDGDHLLTLEELCTPFGPLGTSAAQSTPTPCLVPRHRFSFQLADQNGDGKLSANELAAAPDLYRVTEIETHLQQYVQQKFNSLDQDANGELSREEAGTNVSDQHFQIADFNESQTLTLLEFASLPTVSSLTERPEVPDPVLNHVEEVHQLIQSRWPREKRALAPVDAVYLLASVCSFITADDLAGWDTDHSGNFDTREVQQGLLVLFGVRTPSGLWLRRANGQVFNDRSFQDADDHSDQSLDRSDFERSYWKQGREAATDFQRADLNRDQRLSRDELLISDIYWNDSLQDFLRFDVNQDGRIDAEELRRKALPHERRIAQSVFPAFDRNADQVLNFLEYRLSPLANPLHDYDSRRWDENTDGVLSLSEFHRSLSPKRRMMGLSALFFQQYDRNGNGQLEYREYKFSANLKVQSIEFVFQVLDTNADGNLQLEELLQREKPVNQSAWAMRNSERRMIEVEEAFESCDRNHDKLVSLSEFQDENSALRKVVLGIHRPKRGLASSSPKVTDQIWGRNMAFIFVANLALFGGLAWWRFRR